MQGLKVQEQDGKLTVEVQDRTRSERQRRALKALLSNGEIQQAVRYLSSFGRYTGRHPVPRLAVPGYDRLAAKKSGTIAAMFRQMLDTDRDHKPAGTSTDWIGVEIECCIPREAFSNVRVCSYCEGSGYQLDSNEEEYTCPECDGSGEQVNGDAGREQLAELFQEEKIKHVSIKSDGSIQAPSGYFPVEVTVLTRLSSPENLKRACSFLNRIGAIVNKSCGMHVHLDARHLSEESVKVIGKRFERALPVMLAMVPETRRRNSYCQASVSGLTGGRYHAVNLTSYRKHRTVEVRLHSSTTDFNKIINWSRFISAIAASEIKRTCQTLNDLTEFVRISEELTEYIGQRTALFSGEQTAVAFQDTDSREVA